MQLTVIAAIFVAIAGVAFALQNDVTISVDFFIWQFSSSLAIVLLLAVALGAILVALLTTPATLRRQWIISQQKKRIDLLEKDLQLLNARVVELEATTEPSALNLEKPYVGLKDIVLSNTPRPDGKDEPAK